MPFQGNPNAGQADPALLQMLFSEKARREERDYKRAQDAMAAQQAQAEFLLKMRAEEQKQRRLQEAHEETMRGKRFENEGKFREFASGVGERQAALPPEARRANETAAIQRLAPTNDVASAFASGDPEEQAFLGIAQEADPGVFDQDLNQIGEATDLASLDPVTRSIIEREAKKQGFSISELFQTAETEAGVVESGRRRELQAEMDKERRAFSNSKALADHQERQIIERMPKQALELNRQIRGLLDRADKVEETNPDKAAALREDANLLIAERQASLNRGLPDSAVANVREVVEIQQRLDLGVSISESLAQMEELSTAGSPAQLERFLSNAVGLSNDIGLLLSDPKGSFEDTLARADVPDEVKEGLVNVLVRGLDPERQTQLSDAELTAVRANWLLISEGARGRVSLTELRNLAKVTNPLGLFTSTLRAKGRIRATKTKVDLANESLQRSIRLFRPEAEFDERGRLSVGNTPPVGNNIPSSSSQVGVGRGSFSVAPDVSATDILLDPNLPPDQAIRQALEAKKAEILRGENGGK